VRVPTRTHPTHKITFTEVASACSSRELIGGKNDWSKSLVCKTVQWSQSCEVSFVSLRHMHNVHTRALHLLLRFLSGTNRYSLSYAHELFGRAFHLHLHYARTLHFISLVPQTGVGEPGIFAIREKVSNLNKNIHKTKDCLPSTKRHKTRRVSIQDRRGTFFGVVVVVEFRSIGGNEHHRKHFWHAEVFRSEFRHVLHLQSRV
jgi:hypothetical protein